MRAGCRPDARRPVRVIPDSRSPRESGTHGLWLDVRDVCHPGGPGVLLFGLVRDLPTDALFVGAVVLLAALGVIKPEEAFAGFGNAGMLTVAALFVVAAALRETGVMEYVGDRFLGHVETEGKALLLMAVVLIPLGHGPEQHAQGGDAGAGAHRLVPQETDLALAAADARSRSCRSWGGRCSLIGTSTNLVVQGLLIKNQLRPMSMFELGYVGLPCASSGRSTC